MRTVFSVIYRIGLGAAGNVAADTITQIDPASAGLITGVAQSLRGHRWRRRGDRATTSAAWRRRRSAPCSIAPCAPRTMRQRPRPCRGCRRPAPSFRWTGSWMTVFTAVDPLGGRADQRSTSRSQLVELLNRRRLAGYESYAPPPHYLSLDLRIEVCVLDRLARRRRRGRRARSSRQRDAAGRRQPASSSPTASPSARRCIAAGSRRRSRTCPASRACAPSPIASAAPSRVSSTCPRSSTPATGQILRVDNDPSWPERGTIRVIAEGGR